VENRHLVLSTNIYEFKASESELIHHIKRNEESYMTVDSNVDLYSFLRSYPSAIVYLFPLDEVDTYELCGELSLEFPYATIVLMFKQAELNYKKAMFVGATDSIVIPTSSIDLKNCIYKVKGVASLRAEKMVKKNSTKNRKEPTEIITICSGKGGVGKTTLTVNLATQLANFGKRVAILDLDLQFGDVNIFLNVKSRKTIYDWAMEYNGNKHAKINRYLSKFQDNLSFVSAPVCPEQADIITGEHIEDILEQLSLDYEVIVIDTPPLFTEPVLAALNKTSKILIPTTPNLTTIKNVKTTISTLKQLDWDTKSHVILNRATEAKKIISRKEIEEIINKEIWEVIPSDYKTSLTSINFGIPFVNVHPSKNISKAIVKIVNKLEINYEKKKTKLNLFSQMIKKKKNGSD